MLSMRLKYTPNQSLLRVYSSVKFMRTMIHGHKDTSMHFVQLARVWANLGLHLTLTKFKAHFPEDMEAQIHVSTPLAERVHRKVSEKVFITWRRALRQVFENKGYYYGGALVPLGGYHMK